MIGVDSGALRDVSDFGWSGGFSAAAYLNACQHKPGLEIVEVVYIWRQQMVGYITSWLGQICDEVW